jgi:hypothetical protein
MSLKNSNDSIGNRTRDLPEILGSDRVFSDVKRECVGTLWQSVQRVPTAACKHDYRVFSHTYHFLQDVSKTRIVEFATLVTLTSGIAEGESEERNERAAEREC